MYFYWYVKIIVLFYSVLYEQYFTMVKWGKQIARGGGRGEREEWNVPNTHEKKYGEIVLYFKIVYVCS